MSTFLPHGFPSVSVDQSNDGNLLTGGTEKLLECIRRL